MARSLTILLFVLLFPLGRVWANPTEIPRTVFVLWDSEAEKSYEKTMFHWHAEVVLNHFGLRAEAHDVQKGLPSFKGRDDVRGLITWFPAGFDLPSPLEYIKLLQEAESLSKKILIIGEPGFFYNSRGDETPKKKVKEALSILGLKANSPWVFDDEGQLEFRNLQPRNFLFERPWMGFEKGFQGFEPIDDSFKAYAEAFDPKRKTRHIMAGVGKNGGFVVPGYVVYQDFDEKSAHTYIKWIVNPFKLIAESLAVENEPIPDANTMAGRRIYYSHIDGDGFNNPSSVSKYVRQGINDFGKSTITAEVILKEAIQAYPDLPVTFAMIGAEIDPEWSGSAYSVATAKAILAEPQVEGGSHTYSHPFDWHYFADQRPEKEIVFLDKYGDKAWQKSDLPTDAQERLKAGIKADFYQLKTGYEQPRGFAHKPFDLDLEISGSLNLVQNLLPAGKTVKSLMWSGNCLPFEAAIEKTRLAKVANINGGDTRMDGEYPSYAWVSPLGRMVGKEMQIYASGSNENTYTDLWMRRFYAYKSLVHTAKNTETPVRVSPYNVYYHTYIAENDLGLSALRSALDYARSANISPIAASDFFRVAKGSLSAKIVKVGENKWQILDRHGLSTTRFEKATFKEVDFDASVGVIGQVHFQGSLYVYLDDAVLQPTVAIKKRSDYWRIPQARKPYIVDSRWPIKDFSVGEKSSVNFTASGYGKPDINIYLPSKGKYQATMHLKSGVAQQTTFSTDDDGKGHIAFDVMAHEPARFTISKLDS